MAKSPTPIPAPPVKIQRDTNGAAPAAPATKPKKAAPQKRRKRRRNPLLWFLHGLIRRIYFGLKTASRLVLLVPILVFMVAFSYNVDRSALSNELSLMRQDGILRYNKNHFVVSETADVK